MAVSPPMRGARATVQRNDISRVSQVAAQGTWVMGRVLVEGVGEAQVDVVFPVTFGERPLPILGGGEMVVGDSPEVARYPTANAIVASWDTDGTYYRGATLAISTTGRAMQQLYVTFAFVGLALTNAGSD